jgi:hypothetical protein
MNKFLGWLLDNVPYSPIVDQMTRAGKGGFSGCRQSLFMPIQKQQEHS